MNVFGILSSDDEETLTEENYCEKTNKDAIIRKSKYFKLETEENARIVQKEKNLRYPKIRLVLFGHKIIDEEEIIKLKMYEEIDGKEKVLMNIELDVMDCPL